MVFEFCSCVIKNSETHIGNELGSPVQKSHLMRLINSLVIGKFIVLIILIADHVRLPETLNHLVINDSITGQ